MQKTLASLKDSLTNLQRGIFSASNTGALIAIVLLVLLVLLTVVDVIMRRFLNAPIGGTFELTRIILGTIVFFSLAYCAVKGGHIVVDVLVTRFPQWAQSSVRIIIHLLSVVIMLVISWRLFAHAVKMASVGEVTAIWNIPVYPFVLLAGLGSTLATIVFLIQLFHTITEARGKWT